MPDRARGTRSLFVGDDWAEAHHDVEIQDETGRRLARRRLPEGVAGIGQLHALLADQLPVDTDPDQVVVGTETDHDPWVQALLAAGYQVFPVNPLSATSVSATPGRDARAATLGRWSLPPEAGGQPVQTRIVPATGKCCLLPGA